MDGSVGREGVFVAPFLEGVIELGCRVGRGELANEYDRFIGEG